MPQNAFALTISREELPDLVASGDPSRFEPRTIDQLAKVALRQKQIIVGYWGKPAGDPYPDFMAFRDDEFADTQAWLSAFMAGAAPVSQWCRLWPLSDLASLARVSERPHLGGRYGGWIGAIIAESSAHVGANLKDVSGVVALTSASFCAARALAVWGEYGRFDELAKRHDSLSNRSRDGSRVGVEQLLPLWYVLSGDLWLSKPSNDARPLTLFRELVDDLVALDYVPQDHIVNVARQVAIHFDLPELALCATGPQGQRVDALDNLGARILTGPKSSATSAIMGFGASMVDPGASVLPELLRRYSSSLPAAGIWAGAFAGIWFPVRVLSEHGGLGRMIGKELTAPSDIFTKPRADVSFDELSRWTGGTFGGRFPVRGLMNRTLSIELLPGVTAPFSNARSESAQSAVAIKQQSLDLGATSRPIKPVREQATDAHGPSEGNDLVARITRLEQTVEEFVRKGGFRASAGRQPKAKP